MKSFEKLVLECGECSALVIGFSSYTKLRPKIEIFSRKYRFEQRHIYIFMQFLSLFAKIQLSYSVIENNRYFSLNPKG